MKFLVDECLSEELTKSAQRRGHAEASHVTWIGKRGWKDWELKKVILDGDWVFVTKNSIAFRGPGSAAGSAGQYADVVLHAGLVCLNGPVGMDLDIQLETLLSLAGFQVILIGRFWVIAEVRGQIKAKWGRQLLLTWRTSC